MKKTLVILMILVTIAGVGLAEWADVPLDELVQRSDLIIVGRLLDASEHTKDGIDYGKGFINVSEVILSGKDPGRRLTLTWQNPSGLACPRVSHPNQKTDTIWLLTFGENGEVNANYPGRVVDLKQKAEVLGLLRKYPVVIRVPQYTVAHDAPANVAIVLRNATEKDITLPDVKYENGVLSMDSRMQIKLYDGKGDKRKEIPPLANRIVISKEKGSMQLKSKEEVRVNLDLKTLFDMKNHVVYSVQVTVEGYEQPAEAKFYIKNEESSD